jgi:hypothetical protein
MRAMMERDLSDHLNDGGSLIIKGWPSPELCRILQQHAAYIASLGKNVLVLDEDIAGSAKEFGEIGLIFLRHVFFNRDDFTQGNGYSCSLWRFSEMLGSTQEADWLRRLGLVIVPVGDRIFGNLFEWELMGKRLRDRLNDDALPQFLVVVGERLSPESSLRRIFPIFDRKDAEFSMLQGSPEHVWWTVWTSQQAIDYAQARGSCGGLYCGIEPVLADFAGERKITRSILQQHPAVATRDHCEALQRTLGTLHIGEQENDAGWPNACGDGRFVGALTLRDPCGNPWRTLQTCLAAGQRDVLVNIVSRHTMLSAYQLANAAFFAQHPLDPLSPMLIDQDPFGTLVQLLLRIERNDEFRLSLLQETLDAAAISSKPGRAVADFKHELVRHEVSQAADSITVHSLWDWHPSQEGLDFGRVAFVSLGGHDVSLNELGWLREFQVKDNAGNVFHRLRQDHVSQTYQPGKVCVFDHKTYQVERIDWRNASIYVAHHDTQGEPDYRDIRRVELLETLAESEVLHLEDKQIGGLAISAKVHRVRFRITTEGYVESPDHWASAAASKTNSEHCVREYPYGRVARLSFRNADAGGLLSPGAAVALAQWLNEAAITLFPESHAYFLAVADVTDGDYPTQEPASSITPRLTGEKCRQQDGSVLIFEDSHSDLGIPRGAIRQWNYLLGVCLDFLAWFLLETAPETRIGRPGGLENTNLLIPPKDFFAYGQTSRDPKIDLPALHEALSRIPTLIRSDSVTQGRHRALEEPGLPLVDEHASHDALSCDFCGAHIEGGEREVFQDGRIRCPACSACGVDKFEQLPALYKVAVGYFKKRLNIDFAENVDVRLTTPIELAKIQNKTFIPTSGFDSRAVGLSRSRTHTGSIQGETRHTVLIESGFSPEQTTSTLVHELTHIWQFNMLNHERMRADYGVLLIEGHAMWSEQDFLRQEIKSPSIPGCAQERLAKAAASVENIVASESEYGRGFRLLQQNSPGPANPFDWLRMQYPHT